MNQVDQEEVMYIETHLELTVHVLEETDEPGISDLAVKRKDNTYHGDYAGELLSLPLDRSCIQRAM